MTITLAGLLIGFAISMAVSNQGLIHLKKEVLNNLEDPLNRNTQQILSEYLNESALMIETQLSQTAAQQQLLKASLQGYMDLAPLTEPYNAIHQIPNSEILNQQLIQNNGSLQSIEDLEKTPSTTGLIHAWENMLVSGTSKATQNTPIFISPFENIQNGQKIMAIKSVLWDSKRTTITGALSYDYSMESLINKIETLHATPTSFAFLSQSNGNVFALNQQGLKTLGMDSIGGMIQSKAAKVDLFKQNFKNSRYQSVQNIPYPSSTTVTTHKLTIEKNVYWLMTKRLKSITLWDANKQFKEEAWVIGIVIPEKDFMTPIQKIASSIENSTRDILLIQAAIILLLFAFITSIIFLIYEKLTENLSRLVKATEQVKKRNFGVTLTVESEDEFGILAQSFNAMTSEMQATIHQLTLQNQILKGETDSKSRMDEQIAYMKQYDSLTGLPNKQSLYRRLEEYALKSIQEKKLGALVVIGLDNFKRINEAYGVEVGDDLLKVVAERLRDSVNADSVSRITGDEFGVVFYGLTVLEDLIARLDHLKLMLNKPFNIGGINLYITASYGISSFPEDSANAKEIVKFATNALLSAKENAKDHYRFYDRNIEQNIKNKVDLMNALRQCIERNELKLVYQPIVDQQTQKIVGVEALVRWNNHQFGYIPPNIFIPIAEEINFVSEIERWVVNQVIADIEIMSANKINDLYVSINLSALDLDSNEFMDFLELVIKQNILPANRVQLEITEGVLINRYDHIVPRLRRFSTNGVRIALDDFGTGYSSLKYIKRLPISCLKIDRSFVKDYPDYDDGSIAKIIINLATTLNLCVIAEGVETKQQVDFLNSIGCSLHQGYYYSKAVPLDRILYQYHSENHLDVESHT